MTRRHSGGPHRQIQSTTCGGFTLIEITIVLMILAITAGVVIPRISASSKRMADSQFLQDFIQTIRRARLQAMNSGKIVDFRIRSTSRRYGLQLPPDKPIPTNVDIYADNLEVDPQTQDHMIVFYPDGSLIGDSMEIVFDKTRTFRISINPLLGTVTWSKGKSS